MRAAVSACGVAAVDIDDQVQDAWVELMRALPGLQLDPSRGSLLAWMRTVVYRVTRDRLRRPLPALVESYTVVNSLRAPNTSTPDAECERCETRAAVRLALESFRRQTTQLNYRVLLLISFEERTAAETAAQLSLAKAQVWARRHRVKQQFGQVLRSRKVS